MSREAIEADLLTWREACLLLAGGDASNDDLFVALDAAHKVVEAAKESGIPIEELVPDETERLTLLDDSNASGDPDDEFDWPEDHRDYNPAYDPNEDEGCWPDDDDPVFPDDR